MSKEVVLICAAALTFSNALAAGSGQWRSNIQEASAEAQRLNKPLLLDFWAAWCAPCKVMDAQVYTDAFLETASRRLLPVRIDFDKEQAVARKYRVAGLPAIVFTDSYGSELFRHSGYIEPKAMAKLIEALPTDVRDFNHLDRILAADKDNFEALVAMGRNLRAAGFFRTSNEYYARAIGRREASSDRSTRETILTETGLNWLELEEGKEAAGIFEKCLKEFPRSQRALSWTLSLARAYGMENRKDKANKLLEALLRKNPEAANLTAVRRILDSLSSDGGSRGK